MLEANKLAGECEHVWDRYKTIPVDYLAGPDIVGMSYCVLCHMITLRDDNGIVWVLSNPTLEAEDA
jgi:hypothetical protein